MNKLIRRIMFSVGFIVILVCVVIASSGLLLCNAIDNGNVKLVSFFASTKSLMSSTLPPTSLYRLAQVNMIARDGKEDVIDDKTITKIAEILVSRGADVNACFGSQSILSASVCAKNTALINFLIENNVSVNSTNKLGMSVLHEVFLLNSHLDLGILNLLLRHGADVNLQDSDGNTPLHWAVFVNDYNAALRMIEAGGELQIKNNKGESVLDLLKSSEFTTEQIDKIKNSK